MKKIRTQSAPTLTMTNACASRRQRSRSKVERTPTLIKSWVAPTRRQPANRCALQKSALTADRKSPLRDEQTKEELEAIRKSQGSALAKKREFEAGKSSLVGDADGEAESIEDRIKEMVAGERRARATPLRQ